MSKKQKVFVTTRDLTIPKGTKMPEWKGKYETVIGITKDTVAYFGIDKEDVNDLDGYLRIEEDTNESVIPTKLLKRLSIKVSKDKTELTEL